jgi:hypothetical protein
MSILSISLLVLETFFVPGVNDPSLKGIMYRQLSGISVMVSSRLIPEIMRSAAQSNFKRAGNQGPGTDKLTRGHGPALHKQDPSHQKHLSVANSHFKQPPEAEIARYNAFPIGSR